MDTLTLMFVIVTVTFGGMIALSLWADKMTEHDKQLMREIARKAEKSGARKAA